MKDLIYKISVPEPCTEDFSKMTPNGNGSFCNSCEKTVVDFSKMNDTQVSQYITAHPDQKICGRFTTAQLNKPVGPSVNTTVSALQAFIASLILVFGAALFEFTYVPGSFDGMFKGPPVTEAPYAGSMNTVGLMIPMPLIAEDTTAVEPETETVTVTDVVGQTEVEIRDSVVKLPEVKISSKTLVSCYTMGDVWIQVRPEENLPIVNPIPVDSFYLAKEEKPSLPNDVIASPTLESYPNPTNGTINIRYMLPQQADVTIEIYDLNGSKMMDLVSIDQMYEGTYIYPADLSELANGMYICRMVAGEKVFTSKIVLSK